MSTVNYIKFGSCVQSIQSTKYESTVQCTKDGSTVKCSKYSVTVLLLYRYEGTMRTMYKGWK